MDEEISRLKTTAVSLLNDLGCNGSTLTEDLINEMCRYGAAELHAVAAYVGGVASQEIIKVKMLILVFHLFIFYFSCPRTISDIVHLGMSHASNVIFSIGSN